MPAQEVGSVDHLKIGHATMSGMRRTLFSPEVVDTFRFSLDSEFAAEVADFVGLCLEQLEKRVHASGLPIVADSGSPWTGST